MGDIGEYWNEFREKEQKRKADRLKWNTDVTLWAAEEYGFKLKKHTNYHYSLFHAKKGEMQLWPSTGRISWVKYKKTMIIDDIEAYLMEHFKQK